MVFVLDGSDSIKPAAWKLLLGFVDQLLKALPLKDSAMHVGLVQYAAAASIDGHSPMHSS